MPSQSPAQLAFQAGHPPDAAGRSTSRLRATGHGGGLVPVLVSVAFVRLRSPTSGVTLSCGQAGNTPERPGSRVGKRVGLTATVTATWLREDRSAVNLSVQLAPSTDCHGLWDRPGPDLMDQKSVQQRSTATTAPSNTFGFIQMRPGQREKARSGDCAEFGTKC